MAAYGEEHGELLGGATSTITTHEDDIANRWSEPLITKPQLDKLARIFGERSQRLENVIFDLLGQHDIDGAFGQLQDDIGAVLRLLRQGFGDDRYRVFLRTQAQIVLPNRRTVTGILGMIRSLLDDDVRDIELNEVYPKAFLLVVEDLTDEEIQTFPAFVRLAKPATYNAQFINVDSDAFGYSDATAAVVTTKLGFDNASAPPSFGGDYGFVIPI